MQDYPQHLFISKVLATYNEPTYDWHAYYPKNGSYPAAGAGNAG